MASSRDESPGSDRLADLERGPLPHPTVAYMTCSTPLLFLGSRRVPSFFPWSPYSSGGHLMGLGSNSRHLVWAPQSPLSQDHVPWNAPEARSFWSSWGCSQNLASWSWSPGRKDSLSFLLEQTWEPSWILKPCFCTDQHLSGCMESCLCWGK